MRINIRQYIIAAAAALLMAASASAQIVTSQWIEPVEGKTDEYKLSFETYVKGTSSTTTIHVETVKPLDAVLVLDVSGSMNEKMKRYTYHDSGITYSSDKNLKNLSGWMDYSFLGTGWQSIREYYVNYDNYYYNVRITRIKVIGFYLDPSAYFTTSDGKQHSLSELTDKKLYTRTEEDLNQTKMEALKDAVEAFINTVQSKSTSAAQHRISIVKFAGDNNNSVGDKTYSSNYNYSQVVMGLSSDFSGLKSAVNNLKAGGATSADYGMAHAANILKNADGGDRTKVVIMFTDGEPNHGSGFDNDVAEATISASKGMKDSGVSVYTVGIFSEESDLVDDYMSFTSSNYPKAVGMDESKNGKAGELGYYKLASTADELTDIFETIASESTSNTGGASIDLSNVEKVTLRDMITPAFMIPEGAESIQMFTEDYQLDETWANRQPAPESVRLVSTDSDADGNTSVDVKGFNFSENWVGVEKFYNGYREDVSKRKAHGKKLIIEVIVVPDPDAPGDGGIESVCDERSGVYIDGMIVSENPGGAVKNYDVPEHVIVPADLIIKKRGLRPGESAVFKVTNDYNDMVYTIMMTADTYGVVEDAVIKRVPVKTSSGDFITYTVDETSWSWTYNSSYTGSNTNSHSLVTYRSNSYYQTNRFEFTNSHKLDSSLPKHAEAAKNIQTK